MKNKVVSLEESLNLITDGMTIMIGGFLAVGTPESIIDGMIKKGVKDITIIANDTGNRGMGISKLIASKAAKKVIVSHIGTNPETAVQMNADTLDVDLVPQGTLAERIRSGGTGLGGFLTPTGLGTSIEEGKQKITVEGTEYLLELPLKANVAIIKGSVVDTEGNIYYNGTTKNFNPLMAMAADVVIVEAEKIVESGEINPNNIMTPGIFVDYIVGGKN